MTRYRDPASLVGRWVCCHCKRLLTVHTFTAPDGHRLETHHCPEHGDVTPMRSVVVNGTREWQAVTSRLRCNEVPDRRRGAS